MVGPNASLNKIPRLNTSSATLDIDLIGIAKKNNGISSFTLMFKMVSCTVYVNSNIPYFELLFLFIYWGSGSAAVTFMSYINFTNILGPELFKTAENMEKTMMSTVVSAVLVKTPNPKLTAPVNFTLKHIAVSYCIYNLVLNVRLPVVLVHM